MKVTPKYQTGNKITQDQIDQADKNRTYLNPSTFKTPELKKVENDARTDEKTTNFITDMGTGALTMGSQFRFPSQDELEKGRAGWKGRVPLLAQAITYGLGNELMGGTAYKTAEGIGKVVGGIEDALPNITKKLMNIPGVTADAPEKGYHALNLDHWALHPGKLVEKVVDSEVAVPLKDKLLLYGEAAGNRIMSPLMRTPLSTPIKKLAEKVMNISGGSPTMSLSKLKNISYATPEFGKYAGSLGGETDINRNLIRTYLYGEPGSMVEAGKDVANIPLGERFDKLYPKAKTYMMNSSIKHGEPVYSDAYALPTVEQGAVGRTRSPASPIDDIGGHMIQNKIINGKPTLITQDLWKFNPKDYSGRWGGWGGESNPFLRLKAEKEAGMLDKVGNPFYLLQNNPIVEVGQGTPKSTNRFNLNHFQDIVPNYLKELPKEIIFKRRGGRLIPKHQTGSKITEQQVLGQFPGLKAMQGKIVLQPNSKGVHGVEYIGPDTPSINYSDSVKIPHPQPGKHADIYNPETETPQTLALDFVSHGLSKEDPAFNYHKEEFKKNFLASPAGKDATYWGTKRFNEQQGDYKDSKDELIQNEVDGGLRNLLFKGDYKKFRYYDKPQEWLADPKLKESFQRLQDYLQVPGSIMLPEASVTAKRIIKK